MSYTAITSAEVTAGEPTTSTLMGKVKDNFSDHETRITSLEAGSGVSYPPIIFRVNGRADLVATATRTGFIMSTCNFGLTITGARLIIQTAGSSGTTEIDIQYKRGGGAWTSIFSTKPSVAYTAGDNAVSSNAVIDIANDDLQAGDLIRMNISSAQTSGSGFLVRLDFTKT
jgi:hypothetical protein